MEKKINTPYDPAVQVPCAIDKEIKQKQLDMLLKFADILLKNYLKSNDYSVKKDKQLSQYGLVIFEKNDSYLVYRYTSAGRDWIVEYKK